MPSSNSSELLDSLQLEIDAIVQAELTEFPAPGVVVGIVRDDSLAMCRSYGVADLARGDTPSQRSIARVASVTKTFTATAIMQLRDASLLSLDDPLLIYIPEFTVAQAIAGPLEGVTIRRLLTHYSGLTTEHPEIDWDAPDFPTRERLVDSLELLKVVIPQDSQWKYSNLAYGLLGEVIARLSGRPYVEYVQDEVIRPLGLEHTDFDLSPAQHKLKMTGYSPANYMTGESNFRIAPVAHLNGFTSAGQLHSNAEDLAKWVRFQLGSGPESVLSQASLAEMHRPVYIESDWSSGQCIGWRATRRGDRVYLNHGGAVHGFATSVLFNVPEKTGLIVLSNVWPTPLTGELPIKIAEAVINAAGPVGIASIPEPQPPKPTEFDGRYWAEPGLPVNVASVQGGMLSFAKPSKGEGTLHAPALLAPSDEGGDSFRVVNGRGAGETAVFERGGSSEITGFRLGGFKYRKIQ